MPQHMDVEGKFPGFQFREPHLASIKPHLIRLGALFLEYNMQEHWAIGFLHYEFNIKPDLVMVHKQQGTEKYCLPLELETLNMDQLKPHTYRLDGGVLQPLEFEFGLRHRLTPPSDFLSRLAVVLQEIPGGYMFALYPRQSQVMSLWSIFWTDTGGAGGFCAKPFDPTPQPSDLVWIETQWNFDSIRDAPGPHDALINDDQSLYDFIVNENEPLLVRQPLLEDMVSEDQELKEDIPSEGLGGDYWPLRINVQQKCLIKRD